MILCHTNKIYLNYLQQYKIVIKQRNSLLSSNPETEYLKIWNQKLSDLGEKIWHIRKDFFNDFIVIFNELWGQLNCDFKAEIQYDAKQALSSSIYYKKLLDGISNDIKKGYTTQGPHRDKINLFFNNMMIKNCGSQGAINDLWGIRICSRSIFFFKN